MLLFCYQYQKILLSLLFRFGVVAVRKLFNSLILF